MKKKKKLALLLKVGSGKMFFSIDYHFHHHQSMKSSHICRFLIWLQLPHTYQLQQNRCQIEFLLWHMLTFIKTALFNRTQCITVSSLRAQKPAVISDPLTRAFQLDFAVIRKWSDATIFYIRFEAPGDESQTHKSAEQQYCWGQIQLRRSAHTAELSLHTTERPREEETEKCLGVWERGRSKKTLLPFMAFWDMRISAFERKTERFKDVCVTMCET